MWIPVLLPLVLTLSPPFGGGGATVQALDQKRLEAHLDIDDVLALNAKELLEEPAEEFQIPNFGLNGKKSFVQNSNPGSSSSLNNRRLPNGKIAPVVIGGHKPKQRQYDSFRFQKKMQQQQHQQHRHSLKQKSKVSRVSDVLNLKSETSQNFEQAVKSAALDDSSLNNAINRIKRLGSVLKQMDDGDENDKEEETDKGTEDNDSSSGENDVAASDESDSSSGGEKEENVKELSGVKEDSLAKKTNDLNLAETEPKIEKMVHHSQSSMSEAESKMMQVSQHLESSMDKLIADIEKDMQERHDYQKEFKATIARMESQITAQKQELDQVVNIKSNTASEGAFQGQSQSSELGSESLRHHESKVATKSERDSDLSSSEMGTNTNLSESEDESKSDMSRSVSSKSSVSSDSEQKLDEKLESDTGSGSEKFDETDTESTGSSDKTDTESSTGLGSDKTADNSETERDDVKKTNDLNLAETESQGSGKSEQLDKSDSPYEADDDEVDNREKDKNDDQDDVSESRKKPHSHRSKAERESSESDSESDLSSSDTSFDKSKDEKLNKALDGLEKSETTTETESETTDKTGEEKEGETKNDNAERDNNMKDRDSDAASESDKADAASDDTDSEAKNDKEMEKLYKESDDESLDDMMEKEKELEDKKPSKHHRSSSDKMKFKSSSLDLGDKKKNSNASRINRLQSDVENLIGKMDGIGDDLDRDDDDGAVDDRKMEEEEEDYDDNEHQHSSENIDDGFADSLPRFRSSKQAKKQHLHKKKQHSKINTDKKPTRADIEKEMTLALRDLAQTIKPYYKNEKHQPEIRFREKGLGDVHQHSKSTKSHHHKSKESNRVVKPKIVSSLHHHRRHSRQ